MNKLWAQEQSFGLGYKVKRAGDVMSYSQSLGASQSVLNLASKLKPNVEENFLFNGYI
jgi:hypothetical protein